MLCVIDTWEKASSSGRRYSKRGTKKLNNYRLIFYKYQTTFHSLLHFFILFTHFKFPVKWILLGFADHNTKDTTTGCSVYGRLQSSKEGAEGCDVHVRWTFVVKLDYNGQVWAFLRDKLCCETEGDAILGEIPFTTQTWRGIRLGSHETFHGSSFLGRLLPITPYKIKSQTEQKERTRATLHYLLLRSNKN